jgi:hypothetical protein
MQLLHLARVDTSVQLGKAIEKIVFEEKLLPNTITDKQRFKLD